MKSPLEDKGFIIQLRKAVANELYEVMSDPAKSRTHPDDAEIILRAIKCGLVVPSIYRDNENIEEVARRIGKNFFSLTDEDCVSFMKMLFGKSI
jgi:hypothetical protein